jgi:hypothetical protein
MVELRFLSTSQDFFSGGGGEGENRKSYDEPQLQSWSPSRDPNSESRDYEMSVVNTTSQILVVDIF